MARRYQDDRHDGWYWKPRSKGGDTQTALVERMIGIDIAKREPRECPQCGQAKNPTAFVTQVSAMDGPRRVYKTCNNCRRRVWDMSWQDSANCAETDPEIFFENISKRSQEERLRNICAQCPVATQCLKAAFDQEGIYYPRDRAYVWGFRGGLRANERLNYHKKYVELGADLNAAQTIIDEVLYSEDAA